MNQIQITKVVLVAFLVIFCAGRTYSAWADDHGTHIAQRVYDRPDGTTTVTKTLMVLQDRNSQPRQREFFTYRKEIKNGETNLLIRFTSPKDVKDTGLLTQSYMNGKSDQWLYLPAMKSIRRIAGERKGGRFVGSDVYYEDIQDRKVTQDVHTFLRQEQQSDVIESVPIDADSSTYSKRVVWVDNKTLIPMRIDFYQNNGAEPVKRLTVKKVDQIQGFWTVMDSEIVDLKEGHSTRIQIEKITYDVNLPEKLFSQSMLEDPVLEDAYRQ